MDSGEGLHGIGKSANFNLCRRGRKLKETLLISASMPLKLQPDLPASQFSITAHGPGFVEINGSRILGSTVVSPFKAPAEWPVRSVEDLKNSALSALRSQDVELLLLGTGHKQRFPPPKVLSGLMSQGPAGEAPIGVECMDTPAACRTFNLLAAEGRRVLAALIIESNHSDSQRSPPQLVERSLSE